jgi:gamma-tubulin complex component 5
MNIVQRSSISIYQQMFTLLLQTYRAKYVVQRVSPRSIRQIADLRHRQLSYKLRQRLIWFADIMRSYLTETVIELNTSDMIGAMIKAEDIDEMASIHIKYVARLQDQALLSENLKPIHKGIIQILDLAVIFAAAHAADDTSMRTASRSASTTKPSKLSKSSRRKSVIPAIVEDALSDSDIDNAGSDDAAASKVPVSSSLGNSLLAVEKEFERLLPFVTAGLRSVGRVGAEPVWEMLAERLGWVRKS